MSRTEIAAYLVTLGYVGAFLLLSLKQGRASDRPVWIFTHGSRSQRLPALLFKLGFAGSGFGRPFAPGRVVRRRSACFLVFPVSCS